MRKTSSKSSSNSTLSSPIAISLAIGLAVIGGLGLGFIAGGHKDSTSLSSVFTTEKADSNKPYIPQSEAGAYLIAQRAEADSDWPGTHRALENLSDIATLPPEQNARYFLSSIASGDWKTAREIVAQHHDDIAESAPLVRVLYAMMLWSDGKLDEAKPIIHSVEFNPLSQIILPFAKAWMTNETPVLNIIQASQDIGYYTLNLVRFYEAQKMYDKSDALMRKLQEADLSIRLRLWSIAYFERRGLQHDAAQAQSALDEITKNLPVDAWLQEKKAILEEADGHLKSAKHGLSLALVDATEFLDANNASAIALLYTQAALKLTTDLYGGDMLLASLYESQENWEEARISYGKVETDDPSYEHVQLRIAAIFAQEGKLDAAKDKYNQLIKEFPENIELYFQYGEFLRTKEKDYKAAIKAYDQVDSMLNGKIPDSYWALYLARGLSYEMLGDPKQAEANYQKAYDLQPDNSEALNTLAYSWTEQGIHLDKARAMLERALMLNPIAPHILDSYGWVLYKQNNPQEALPYLERAASFMPYDMTVNDHLGDVYNALGRTREAGFMWKRALEAAETEKDRTQIQRKLDTLN